MAQLASLNILRLLAMAGVAVQHLVPIHDELPRSLNGFDPGQAGVALFCGISGFLAFGPHDRTATEWVKRRLLRVLPAYWIALTGALVANAMAHYKPMNFRSVAMQYFGMAAFLDRSEQICQAYWFITIIITAYGITFMLRCRPWTLPIVCAGLFLPWFQGVGAWFALHILAFLACGAIRRVAGGWCGALLAICFVVAFLRYGPVAFYPILVFLTVWAASRVSIPSCALLNWLSQRTYEFFLVHGPIYVAGAILLRFTLAENAIIGTSLAGMAAVTLSGVTARSVSLLNRIACTGRSCPRRVKEP